MMTPRQQQIYETIKNLQRDNGYAPTLDEIREACGLSSKSLVHFELTRLRKRGLVTWKRHTPRTLRVLG